MRSLTDDERAVLAHLAAEFHGAATSKTTSFSGAEIEALQALVKQTPKIEELISDYATIKAWGRLGKLAIWAILTIGATMGVVRPWLLSVFGGDR